MDSEDYVSMMLMIWAIFVDLLSRLKLRLDRS